METKTLIFNGQGNDLFGAIDSTGDDIESYVSEKGEPLEFVIAEGDEALIVFGQFAPGNASGWVVGVAPYDPDLTGKGLPNWPIRIHPDPSNNGEFCLGIDVPVAATVKVFHGRPGVPSF